MKKAIIIPIAIVVLTLVAFATTNAYRVPTLDITFVETRPGSIETVTLTVDGLTCRGKSGLCGQQIQDLPGVVSLTTYVRTHTAIIEYDPRVTDVETIKAKICEPIVLEGKAYDVFSID